MAYSYIYAKREALTAKGESMKAAVQEFMEAKGYALHSDSFIEGTADDMTFNGKESYADFARVQVEAKSGPISFNEEDIILDLLGYFNRWANKATNERFSLWFFARTDKSAELGNLLFEKNDKKAIEAWCEKASEIAKRKLGIEMTKTSKKLLATFLRSIQMHVGDPEGIREAASQYRERATGSIQNYATKKLEEVQRRAKPLGTPSVISTNLVPLRIPTGCLRFDVKATSFKGVFEHYPRFEATAPFVWLGDRQLLTWDHQFARTCYDRIQTADPIPVQTKDIEAENLHRLVGDSLKVLAKQRGLRTDWDRYYAPILQGETVRLTNKAGSSRQVGKLMLRKKDDSFGKTGTIAFGMHEAIDVRPILFENVYYASLQATQVPTEDGRRVVKDGDSRAAILRNWPDQGQDRNGPQEKWFEFWRSFLFHDSGTPHVGLEFGEYPVHQVKWSPETLDRAARTLDNFGGTA